MSDENVTARTLQVLQKSEAQFRAFVTAISDVVYRMSPDWSEMRELDGRGFLADTATPNSTWLDHYIHPDDQASVRAAIKRAIQAKTMFELEHRVRRADGSLGWTLSRAIPILDGSGEITEWLGAASDLSDRRRAEEALLDSEERFRLIVENARDYAIFTTDPQGRITAWLAGAKAVFGFTEDEAIGQDMAITYTEEDRLAQTPRHEREIAAREGSAANVRWHVRNDGGRVFIDGVATVMRGADGGVRGFLKIGQDMTERRLTQERLQKSEEGRSVLLHELQHRVRNLLAVVRSISSRTGKTSASVDDFAMHLDGRLSALARTQMVLTRAPGNEVDLEMMVRDELFAVVASEPQIDIQGPQVSLSPKAAEVLTLAIHELATNAVKYGALSEPAGRVEVRWTIAERLGRSWVDLHWRESGVRVLSAAPRRQGFGTELIEIRVPYELRGSGAMEFLPGGVACKLSFPLRSGESILQTGAPVLNAGNEA